MKVGQTGAVRIDAIPDGSFEGRVVGFYREPGAAGTGVFPQETRLLPIIVRPPLSERDDVRLSIARRFGAPSPAG